MRAVEVALDSPATRRSLWRRGVIAAVLALLAATLLTVAGDQAFSAGSPNLQQHGVGVKATVVAVHARPTGRGRTPTGSLDVQFDAQGRPWLATVDVGAAVSDYQAGETVAIVYDADDPMRVEVVGVAVPGRGVPVPILAVVGALIGAMAIVATRHVAQIRRIVATASWERVESQLVSLPRRFGFRLRSVSLVVVTTSAGSTTLEPVGLNRVDPSFAPTTWVAGLDANRKVLAGPDRGHLVLVRRRDVDR